MKLKNGNYISLVANIVPTINGNIHRKSNELVPSEEFSNLTKHLSLANVVSMKPETLKLNMLVGNDCYLYLPQSVNRISARIESIVFSFGMWDMVMLTYEHCSVEPSVRSHVHNAITRKRNLTDFWNIEALGITAKAGGLEDDYTKRNFK